MVYLGLLRRVDLINWVSNVRPSTKTFFDFNEISFVSDIVIFVLKGDVKLQLTNRYVGRGRRLMHDSKQYDLIQGQGH